MALEAPVTTLKAHTMLLSYWPIHFPQLLLIGNKKTKDSLEVSSLTSADQALGAELYSKSC